ncbi:MAG: PAS domain S-box protein [Vicinamibacterales bacterium]|nr:PAS domain S-box protein [Vicinamibacterales bacterium]
MNHLKSVPVLLGVALISAYFMASAYRRATHDALQQLYAQERILAGQAAQGISTYFRYYRQTLEFLGKDADVLANTERGQRLLRELFLSQQEHLLSLTRVGPDGRILYTYPEERAAGQSILDQPHVRAVFETRRPVVSRVFRSVQGFDCVALHVPVFDGDRFAGSLAALVPFEAISRRYLEGVRIGDSGHALLLSREGIELFCPVPGHTGRPIEETSKDYPAALAMAARMVRGETGTAIYDYHVAGGQPTTMVQKHAYFTPIPLEDTFWSISVTAPEAEALVFIKGFRDRWALGVTILLLAFAVWGLYLARAYLTLGRELERGAARDRVMAAEREREKALREREERFRTYFEDSLLAMAITSPEKGWEVVNDRLTQLLGYSREELRHLDWAQLTHPDDLGADLAQFQRMLTGEIEGYSLEKRFVRKDGAIVHTILSTRLVRRPDGTPDHCLAQLQDITDRKRLDEERTRLAEQLRQSQKLEAIGSLAGGIAHDYNNLLMVQLGHLAMLQAEPGLPAAVADSLAEIEKSTRMAAQLTRQLLAFGRRQVLQIQRLDLNETVGNLSTMLRRVLPEDITFELRTSPSPLWVDADAGSMEQVIVNLVVNARDAMPGGGRLTLATGAVTFTDTTVPPHADARPGRFACLTVADTGRGMDAETQRRIFEPFFTTKDVGKGTGLGLATVYGIVRQHRGWVDVESAPERGAAFRVYFVAADAAAPAVRPPTPAPERAVGQGEAILVAEDNDQVRQVIARSLQRMNYRVLAARDATEAAGLWARHRDEVRLLLSDMVMGEGQNGLQLAHALRGERPQLPVIIMSGHSEDLVGAGLAHDMLFLAKPWTDDALGMMVRLALRPGAA